MTRGKPRDDLVILAKLVNSKIKKMIEIQITFFFDYLNIGKKCEQNQRKMIMSVNITK